MRCRGALFVVCVLAGRVHADEVGSAYFPAEPSLEGSASPACWNMSATFPAEGATDAPRNATVWLMAMPTGDFRLRGPEGEHRVTAKVHEPTRILEIPLGTLDPDQAYTLIYDDRPIRTFTTGRTIDRTPPQPPTIESFAIHGDARGLTVDLLPHPADGTVWFAITMRMPGSAGREVITPAEPFARLPGGCLNLGLLPGDQMCFDVRGIDVAGNRSRPATACTTVAKLAGNDPPPPAPRPSPVDRSRPPQEPYSDPYVAPETPEPHGAPPERRWPVVAVVGSVFAAFVLVIARSRRARRRFSAVPSEPVHPAAVATVAARQRAWRLLAVLGHGVAVVALFSAPDRLHLVVEARVVLACLALAAGVLAIDTAVRTHHAVRLLARPDVQAQTDAADLVFLVRDGTLLEWIAASPGAVFRATSTDLPKATARSRDNASP